MNLIEIILIILGIITILISCRLVDRSKGKEGQHSDSNAPEVVRYSEDERKQQVEELEAQLSELKEEIIVRTDDDLSRISNEKILAVGEYSDQILEKIRKNHEEVVFLYNMLSEKEKEIKTTVREIDASRKQHPSSATKQPEAKEQPSKKVTGIQQVQIQKAKTSGIPDVKEKAAELLSTAEQSINNNSQILSLYSQGKSIVEISKLLELGQGEVKLVIDLFRARK